MLYKGQQNYKKIAIRPKRLPIDFSTTLKQTQLH